MIWPPQHGMVKVWLAVPHRAQSPTAAIKFGRARGLPRIYPIDQRMIATVKLLPSRKATTADFALK